MKSKDITFADADGQGGGIYLVEQHYAYFKAQVVCEGLVVRIRHGYVARRDNRADGITVRVLAYANRRRGRTSVNEGDEITVTPAQVHAPWNDDLEQLLQDDVAFVAEAARVRKGLTKLGMEPGPESSWQGFTRGRERTMVAIPYEVVREHLRREGLL